MSIRAIDEGKISHRVRAAAIALATTGALWAAFIATTAPAPDVPSGSDPSTQLATDTALPELPLHHPRVKFGPERIPRHDSTSTELRHHPRVKFG